GLDRLTGHASRTAQDRDSGQNDMFSGSGSVPAIVLPNAESWVPTERLNREFQAIGFYLSAHPLDEYRDVMERMRVQRFSEFETSVRGGATAGRLAGTVTSRQERRTRTGKRMGIVQFSDPSGQFEAVIFEEGLAQYRDMLESGNSVVILAGAEMRPEGIGIRIQSVDSLEEHANRERRNLRIFLRDREPVSHLTPLLTEAPANRDDGRVSLVVVQDNGACEIEVELKSRYDVNPKIKSAIKAVPGIVDVELV
ncbi:MAG: OB-fold nucleic acid binding domain-containing protein, partial [Pseudomonadota bacterium]